MLSELAPNQLEALNMLFKGYSAITIAHDLKITPQTLSRWKKEPAFIAEMQRMKEDVRNGLTERLLLLADHSLVTLALDIRRHSNPKTALSVLKLLGEDQFALRCVPEQPPAENNNNIKQ